MTDHSLCNGEPDRYSFSVGNSGGKLGRNMKRQLGRQIRCGFLTLACAGSLLANSATVKAEGLVVPLAQANAAAPPPNVTAPPRYYIVESIVVTLLFAAAVFGVCRASGRS